MNKKIKAIMLDSGRVLNKPVTGHWFIAPDFFKYINRRAFQSIPKTRIDFAFGRANQYISKQKLIMTEDEEYDHFLEYYKIFFKQLPELNVEYKLIKLVARDLVYNYDKYEFYKDVPEVLPLLYNNYKLAVVSDAWPSLENVFKKAGLLQYFSTFVISSMIGVTKPDSLMYKVALNELDISPDEAIFIDDHSKNCDGAAKLGVRTFLLCRDYRLYAYNKFYCKNYRVINSLKCIPELIE